MSQYLTFSSIFGATEPDSPLPWKAQDYSIFLRVCQSAWSRISDDVVMGVRLTFAIYLTTVLLLAIPVELFDEDDGSQGPFSFSNLTLITQVLFYWLTFIWTYMYTQAPQEARNFLRQNMENDFIRDRINSVVKVPNRTPKKQLAFSLFYTAAVTSPLISACGFCVLLLTDDCSRPLHLGGEQHASTNGPLDAFVFANKYCVCAVIAVIEVIFLNTVRCQQPFGTHIIAVMTTCLGYILWALFGRLVTGKYVYKYLDPAENGRLGVVFAIFCVTLIAVGMFLFQYFLHSLRQRCTSNRMMRPSSEQRDAEKTEAPRLHISCELVAVLLLLLGAGILGILYIIVEEVLAE